MTGPFQLLSSDSVIIVGNGASLLGGAFGADIDRHDVVVRFNAFDTANFSEHVGRRTTCWFSNRPADSPRLKEIIRGQVFERIYVHTWRDTEAAAATFEEEVRKTGSTTPVIQVDKQHVRDMKDFLGEKYSMFSTGAIAAWLMLREHKFVTLIGFDWWSEIQKYHYFDQRTFQHDPAKGHQPHLEKIFFQKLQDLGRLAFHPSCAAAA